MRPISLLWVVFLALSQAACQTPPEIRTVEVPVTVPCVKSSDVPPMPQIVPNKDLNALNDFDLIIEIASERLDLLMHSNDLHALIKACIQ